MDREITMLIDKITRWSVIIFGTIAALQQVGFNVTAFLTGVGVLGFTVGFALQDVSKNFVAGYFSIFYQSSYIKRLGVIACVWLWAPIYMY